MEVRRALIHKISKDAMQLMYGIRILAFLTTEVYIHHNWYDANKLTIGYG